MVAFPTLKKHCERCNKPFLTKDLKMTYCNVDCENKDRYYKHFNLKDPKRLVESICIQCGEISSSNGAYFCTKHCEKAYNHKKKVESSKDDFIADRKQHRHRLPYEVLNQIEEKKRVFDDSWWRYKINREKI